MLSRSAVFVGEQNGGRDLDGDRVPGIVTRSPGADCDVVAVVGKIGQIGEGSSVSSYGSAT